MLPWLLPCNCLAWGGWRQDVFLWLFWGYGEVKIDDYLIWGKVKSIKNLKSDYVSGSVFHLDVNPLENLEVFAADKAIQGQVSVGDMVSANIWLQGRIVGEEWNILGDD